MKLSKIGEIVECEWLKTVEMQPDMNLWMGEYVVMPNHFHAIVEIGENKYNSDCDQNDIIDHRRRDAMHRVSTNNDDDDNRDHKQKIWHPLFVDLNHR